MENEKTAYEAPAILSELELSAAMGGHWGGGHSGGGGGGGGHSGGGGGGRHS
ncbi:MAG: hypothetical protein AAGA42_06230 [Actinomycetota bacterium]